MRFADRHEAGRLLGERLARDQLDRPLVVGLPRGGVPVAAEVAAALDASLDVLVVRKLGYPLQPELGVGAIAEGGAAVVNGRLTAQLGLSEAELEDVVRREAAELERRVRLYRGNRPPVDASGRTVVVVDDGLATGYTARAAVEAMRRAGAASVVLAVPVAARDTLRALEGLADDVVCLETPTDFLAVGEWYADFGQVGDDEVVALLDARDGAGGGDADGDDAGQGDGSTADVGSSPLTRPVEIPAGPRRLAGELTVPARAKGLVLFAHGSGSSRLSPRNRAVARALERAGLGTLLFDLLTPEEAEDRGNVFDVDLLAGRLVDATHWVLGQPVTAKLPIGLFGASTGAAAALVAAAELVDVVQAVVSRGGRPDLAGPSLGDVRCPTLLLVGGADEAVLELNRHAARQLRCEHQLQIVPGATHLFEEPGTLEAVARSAARFFAGTFDRVAVGR